MGGGRRGLAFFFGRRGWEGGRGRGSLPGLYCLDFGCGDGWGGEFVDWEAEAEGGVLEGEGCGVGMDNVSLMV